MTPPTRFRFLIVALNGIISYRKYARKNLSRFHLSNLVGFVT